MSVLSTSISRARTWPSGDMTIGSAIAWHDTRSLDLVTQGGPSCHSISDIASKPLDTGFRISSGLTASLLSVCYTSSANKITIIRFEVHLSPCCRRCRCSRGCRCSRSVKIVVVQMRKIQASAYLVLSASCPWIILIGWLYSKRQVLEATRFALEPYGDKICFLASVRELLSNFAFLLCV